MKMYWRFKSATLAVVLVTIETAAALYCYQCETTCDDQFESSTAKPKKCVGSCQKTKNLGIGNKMTSSFMNTTGGPHPSMESHDPQINAL